jgi:hypothetical protein
MGIGYAVSPLHRMIFIDQAAIPEAADARFAFPIPQGFRATPWSEVEKHLYSPAIPDIVAWRAKLSEKYRSQLLEPLIWDENSAFEMSEEVSTHADALLRYVAALLDRQGAAEAAPMLFGRDDVPGEDIQREWTRHFGFRSSAISSLRSPIGAGAWNASDRQVISFRSSKKSAISFTTPNRRQSVGRPIGMIRQPCLVKCGNAAKRYIGLP